MEDVVISRELEKARKAAITNRVIRHCVCFGIPAIVMIKMMLNAGEITAKTTLGFVIGFAIIYGVVSSLWAILFKNKAYTQLP